MNITEKNSFVGIDVSKKTLDVHIHPVGKHFKVANDETGFQKLIEILLSYRPEVVAFEASGGYEICLLLALQNSKINYWRIEPRRVYSFKKSEGIYAKTDASDAKVLALFAAEKKQKYKPEFLTTKELQLQSLVRRKDDLRKQLVAEKTRFQQEYDTLCKQFILETIKFLEEQIKEIENKIMQLIQENEEWLKKSKIAQSMKGVGPVLATKLIVSLKELGDATDKEIAALAGVAPYSNQSGNFQGRAFIKGGRSDLRQDLYMAALSAAYHNPALMKFYKKLLKAGKKAKVALIAVARKMLIILNAMFKKQEMWKEV
jgi:transposase